MLGVDGRIFVDKRCSIIEQAHIDEDKSNAHLSKTVGTTGTGCGPANRDRVMRTARQAHEIPELSKYIVDVAYELNTALDAGEDIVIEGTQGFGISLYYGEYPFVTSKDTCAAQMAADNGIGPTRVDDVIVVFKAYPTRVGCGSFKTEMSPAEAKELGIQEFGTVTGRERRIGYWDPEMARYASMVNGCTIGAITGIDHVDPACFGATKYSQLSEKCKDFLSQAEDDIGAPVLLISTGSEMNQIIDLR
jgi:adenylosuccinate synthase